MSYTLWRGDVLLGDADEFPVAGPAAPQPLAGTLMFRPTPAFDRVAAVFTAFQIAAERTAKRTAAALTTVPKGAGPAEIRAALGPIDTEPLDAELRAVTALGLTVLDPHGRAIGGALPVVATVRFPVPDAMSDEERAALAADAAEHGIQLFEPRYVLTLAAATTAPRRAGHDRGPEAEPER